MRNLLLVVLLLLLAIATFNWWSHGTFSLSAVGNIQAPAIDTSKARERGAEIGEKAAEVAGKIQGSVAEAELTSKIKAKMALDDNVRALSIDVTTSGSTVTLTGKVRSTMDRDRALMLARETAGVSRVVDRMDVTR
jgi:hyperosmotically inducible protein